MTSPEDRILSLALAEVVGGRTPPDLAERILAARRTSRRGRRLVLAVAAAAALLLVAAVLGPRLLRPTSPPPPEPPPPVSRGLTAEDRGRLAGWMAVQRESTIGLDPMRPAGLERLKAMVQGRHDLLAFLRDHPDGWPPVREMAVPFPEGPKASDIRSRLVAILVHAPGAAADPLLLERLRAEPLVFAESSLLVLAEAGCEPAVDDLVRRLDAGRRSPLLGPPAAWLALRGDRRGEAFCRWFLTVENYRRFKPAEALACAAGLRRLGDAAAWVETVAAVRADAEARLLEGDLDAARRIVAGLAHWRDVAARGGPATVSDLDRVVAQATKDLARDLPDAASIRRRLARLAD